MQLRAVLVLGLGLATGCLVTPVIHFGGGKSPKQAQQQQRDELVPAALVPQGTWTGSVRVAKVRVWADDDYRAQNVGWQRVFGEQLDDANQLLIPMLGLQLTAEYRSWSHHAPGATLADTLAALDQQDPGDDVFTVIGLTSSLGLAMATFEQLGYASIGGNHLVLRGYADEAERAAFDRMFPKLSAEERDALHAARRQHELTTLLLHELGHNLGLPHETSTDAIMNAMYSQHAATFSENDRGVMLLAIARRLHGPDGDAPAVAQAPPGAPAPLPAAAQAQVQQAEQLAARRDFAGALAILEPLFDAYPAQARPRVIGCQIELARGGPADATARAMCDRARELVTDGASAVELAQVQLAAGDAAAARATLAAEETRLAALAPDAARTGWLALADQYRHMGALTWAENAVARSQAGPTGDGGIAAWAATTRARYGIPADGTRYHLRPEDEGAALAAVRGVLDLVNAGSFAAAAKAARAAEQRWPDLPGLLGARCDLELRRGHLGAARSLCARAVAHDPTSWALYLGAILELQDPRPAATQRGIERLREAIRIDPDLGQAWRALGKALERANASADLGQLRRDYQARFGEPLPM
jgi:tetratricopeptide (TPR) repeat protein